MFLEMPRTFQSDDALHLERCSGRDERLLCFHQLMSSFAKLTARGHVLGVDICSVLGKIWSIQVKSFQHLHDNESRQYEVWIGLTNPSRPFAERRSESVVILIEMAKIVLPFLDRELE